MIDFNSVPTSELIAAYNDLAEPLGHKPVTKFADRATAEKRARLAISSVPPEKRPGRWKEEPMKGSVRAKDTHPAVKSITSVSGKALDEHGHEKGSPESIKAWADEKRKTAGVEMNPAQPVDQLMDKLASGAAKAQAQSALRNAPPKTAKDAQMPALRKANKPLDLAPKSKVYPRKAGTKQAIFVDLLSRPEGATFGELYDALAAVGKPWLGVTIRSGLAWDINHITGYGVTTELLNGEQFAAQQGAHWDRAYEAKRLGMLQLCDATTGHAVQWVPGPGYDPELKMAVYHLAYPKGMTEPLPHIVLKAKG